jgi:signal transduction histidine kinase
MPEQGGAGVRELRRALQAFVAQGLRAVTVWMGLLFLLFAPADLWIGGPHGPALAALDVAIAAVFLAVHLLVRRGIIQDGAINPAMGVVTLAVLPYLSANLLITHDPVQSAGWALWQVCLSLLFLSWPWLLGLLAVSNILWGVLVLRMPPSPAWAQYGFVLASATVIAIVAHGVRLRNIRHLVRLRILERERREELERAQRAARDVDAVRDLNEAKTRFINAAAHELSTPMTPIVLQVDLLRNREAGNLTPRQRHALDVLARNVSRLSALLHDVLDSARLQSGRLQVAKAPVDLRALLEEAVADQEAAAREGGVAVRLDCPAALGAPADSKRLAQVVGNLVANAVQFTPRGGTVTVAAAQGPAQVRVEVTDTGAGVAAE